MFEQKRESLTERLLEICSHEAINNGIHGGVGIGHAVGPRFDLVCGVVWLVAWIERLEEDEDLDGTPTDGKEEDDHYHHLGDFAPDTYGSLRQEVDLSRR